MRFLFPLLVTVCIISLLFNPVAQSQVTISGTVVSAESGAPLPGVSVIIEGTFIGTTTDTGGAYSIGVRSEADILVFSFIGFESQSHPVSPGFENLDIRLEPAVVTMDEVSIIADEVRIFATNVVSKPMMRLNPMATSVAAVIDQLPGVSVQEGDPYGFDDWSSNLAMRGFQITINESQIGTTIDGFPNGTSDYWSGAKANRFIDSGNLGGVEVSQGTADIASHSVEALGGTMNFQTSDPSLERLLTISITGGEYDARRFSFRADTGLLLGGRVRSWISASRQQSTDWVEGSGTNEHDHLAAKFVSTFGQFDLTGYLSHDRIDEDIYQRMYNEADFELNSRWDRLLGVWPGVPYLNQFYRQGWQTRRYNTFGYLKSSWSPGSGVTLTAGAYTHWIRGRGDWLPPYIVDVVDDGDGSESEITDAGTTIGGEQIGLIYFVNPDDASSATPIEGCASSLIFHYYGAGGPEVDPACHPGAVPVQSYRHSHYGKDRVGGTIDGRWIADLGIGSSSFRAGVWYQESRRHLGRDWHRILDPSVSFQWNETAYWHQYEWDFPQTIFRWFIEETLYAGPVTLTAGVRQFIGTLSREDQFGLDSDLSIDYNSSILVSGGITYESPIEGLRLFAGYSDNFKAFPSALLEVPGRAIDQIEPETASNIDIGVQYMARGVAISGTWYSTTFDNRIIYLGPQTVAGPNYLIPGGGSYFNAGGISSTGLELSGTLQISPRISLYTAYTYNNAEYIGSDDPILDSQQGTSRGSDVTGIPDQLWLISLDRSGPISFGISPKYTSERRVSLATDWYTDAYWVVNGYLSYTKAGIDRLFRSAEISVHVHNMFNEAFLSSITENAAWIGPPRTVSISLTLSI